MAGSSSANDDFFEVSASERRSALLQAFVLNAGLAAVLAVGGLLADSSALLANAMCSCVHAMSLQLRQLAASRSLRWKSVAAAINGVIVLALAAAVAYDAGNRLAQGSQPVGGAMVGLSVLALAINAWCVRIWLWSHHSGSKQRTACKLSIAGVLAGALVLFLETNIPDLVLAFLTCVLAAYAVVNALLDAIRQQVERPTP
ncbi:MAG: RND transporter [Variovorax paradoxus]|nr:MAG: RND transporter [Variovorax paradoxus]PZQ00469.1 MAG: RND transporter [Variovorax paradoxus]